MESLTVAFITARRDPKFEWFADSLASQAGRREIHVIIIDAFAEDPGRENLVEDVFGRTWSRTGVTLPFIHALPKPSVWSGKQRLTKENWWSKSNALNSAICLCRTEMISFVDDRSVLDANWVSCIQDSINGRYAVCGYYEKRANMRVENGEAVDPGTLLGADTRTPGTYPFDSWYGGHGALPLEWCMRVQGFPEVADSLGSEDSLFGILLRNFGFPVYYDSRMRLIEDRTPGEIDGALRRSDWGESPRDASHALVEMFRDKTTSQNEFDIRNMRDRVLNGEPFPPPTSSPIHWFSGEQIAEKFI